MNQITKAFEIAYKAHKKQKRKATNIPYIIHPMEVAVILMKNGAGDDLVAAGLLHDVVEDTEVTLSKIKGKFGKHIASLVKGATEPEKLNKNKRNLKNTSGKKSWHERKLHTIEFITTANREMKMLSCADKLSNIRSMIEDYEKVGEKLWDRFNAPKGKQSWYYNSMLKSFGSGKNQITGLKMYSDFKRCAGLLFPRSERRKETAFICMGTNLGNRLKNIKNAIDEIGKQNGITAKSSIYETEPWGLRDQPKFLNAVVKIETELEPELLLDFLQSIEAKLGRNRIKEQRWGPRIIDLDILLYDKQEIQSERLTIPHARMKERAFVLIPLYDINKEKWVRQALDKLKEEDKMGVKKI